MAFSPVFTNRGEGYLKNISLLVRNYLKNIKYVMIFGTC